MKVTISNKEIKEIVAEEVKNRIISEMEGSKYEVFKIKSGDELIETCEDMDEANTSLEEYKKQYPDKHFSIDNDCYGSYEEMLDELENMSENIQESNKKILRLNKPEMIELINRMVSEAKTPGIDAHNKTHGENGKVNKQHVNDSEKKIKDSLKMGKLYDFDQVDKGDKVTIQNTPDKDEYIEDFRGGTLLDLDYGHEPSDKFKDRMKKSLEGHSTMGNSSDAANAVKTDIGKNLQKITKRRRKKREEMPMYNKEPQPVKIVNETLEKDKEKIFKLITYKKRKQ